MPLSSETNGLNIMAVFVGRSSTSDQVASHQLSSFATPSEDLDFDLLGASDLDRWADSPKNTLLQASVADPLKFKPLLVGYLTFLALSRDNVAFDPSQVQVRIADDGADRVDIVLPCSGVDELREGARVARSVFEGLTSAQLRSAVRVIFA